MEATITYREKKKIKNHTPSINTTPWMKKMKEKQNKKINQKTLQLETLVLCI